MIKGRPYINGAYALHRETGTASGGFEASAEMIAEAKRLTMELNGLPMASGDDSSSKPGVSYRVVNKVAIIPIVGVIARYGAFDWWTMRYSRGTMEVMADIQAANTDPNVSSILLWIDSPGGTVDGTEELGNAVFKSVKPVQAAVNGMCASAAYWVASQAQRVWAVAETNQVGSIGVLQRHIDYSGYYEEMGMKVSYITSTGSDDKVVAPESEPLSDEDRAKIVAELDVIRNVFKTHVNRGRKKAGAEVDESAWTGKIMGAKEARDKGLIDGIKTNMQDVLTEVAQAGNGTGAYRDTNNKKKMSFFNKLFGASAIAESPKAEETAAEVAASLKAADQKIADLTSALGEANGKVQSMTSELELARKEAGEAVVAREAAEASLTEAVALKEEAEGKLASLTGELETAKAEQDTLRESAEASASALVTAQTLVEELNAKLALVGSGNSKPSADASDTSDTPPARTVAGRLKNSK